MLLLLYFFLKKNILNKSFHNHLANIMSIFDISSPRSLKSLISKNSETILSEKSNFSGVFALKTKKGSFKSKSIELFDKKIYFSSVIIVFKPLYNNSLQLKSKKKKRSINLEDIYRLNYCEGNTNTDYPFSISLFKFDHYLTLYTSSRKNYEDFLQSVKRFSVLSGFHDEYEILQMLGNGHFASVYMVQKKKTFEYFAAKIIRKNTPSFEQQKVFFAIFNNLIIIKEYIRNEIKILMFLSKNPYVVDFYEVYENNDEIILVLEYMSCNDLYQKIKKNKVFTEQEAFPFFLQILKGLLFLNSQGICHRDIKPDNILFSDEKTLKIADFSLAEYFITNSNKMRGTCGTPGYMAPEIFSHEKYDEKIDVFSLGSVLFTM